MWKLYFDEGWGEDLWVCASPNLDHRTYKFALVLWAIQNLVWYLIKIISWVFQQKIRWRVEDTFHKFWGISLKHFGHITSSAIWMPPLNLTKWSRGTILPVGEFSRWEESYWVSLVWVFNTIWTRGQSCHTLSKFSFSTNHHTVVKCSFETFDIS